MIKSPHRENGSLMVDQGAYAPLGVAPNSARVFHTEAFGCTGRPQLLLRLL